MPPIRARDTRGGNARGNPMGAGANNKFGGPGVLANKAFGQNFLKNPGILDKIMEASGVQATDIAFEIGPGTGNLTTRLLSGAPYVAIGQVTEEPF